MLYLIGLNIPNIDICNSFFHKIFILRFVLGKYNKYIKIYKYINTITSTFFLRLHLVFSGLKSKNISFHLNVTNYNVIML